MRWFVCGVLGVLAWGVGVAEARSEAEVGYTREQTFSAALRYLRVDLAYEVTEKDAEAAYLLFSFSAPELPKKTARGSIEVVQREHTVRLFITLPELPSYQEEVLKRGLLQKLRTEYGEPPARAEPAEPPVDEGAAKRGKQKGGNKAKRGSRGRERTDEAPPEEPVEPAEP